MSNSTLAWPTLPRSPNHPQNTAACSSMQQAGCERIAVLVEDGDFTPPFSSIWIVSRLRAALLGKKGCQVWRSIGNIGSAQRPSIHIALWQSKLSPTGSRRVAKPSRYMSCQSVPQALLEASGVEIMSYEVNRQVIIINDVLSLKKEIVSFRLAYRCEAA